MTGTRIEADYLVVGAGAMGLAFTDELISSSPSATVVLVDRRAKPGGHWNDAYPFVSLHQPAAFYGVNSEKLGSGGDALASGTEVLAYFERVLEKLEATGRLRFLGRWEYNSDGDSGRAQLVSLLAPGRTQEVAVGRKTVDATYMDVRVPATSPPAYAVSPEAHLVPPNALVDLDRPFSRYVVIGAGKTGIDAVLFLLHSGVDPEAIRWVVSNDAWLLDRDMLTPGRTVGWFVDQLALFAQSESLDQVFAANERDEGFLRVDPSVSAPKFRCATVNRQELEALRRVQDVVRLGRVTSIEKDCVRLERGEIPTDQDTLHIDCTADGLAKRPIRKVFDGDRITLQSVFMCQQVFSAALIAQLESRLSSDDEKNRLAQVVPHPEFARDYVPAMAVSNANFNRWGEVLGRWMKRSRLSLAHHEPTLRLLLNTWKARRVGTAATEGMQRIFAEQFPGDSFPAE